MKKRQLIKYIESKGAKFKRHGSNHDVYILGNRRTAVPRHNEIDEDTAKAIFKQLGIKA